MDWIIRPVNKLHGIILPPADKSITHRAIMFASIAEGESQVDNYLRADDCMRTLDAFTAMGVSIDTSATRLKIKGVGLGGLKSPAGAIDAGNSGTTVRLLCGILAGQDIAVRLSGDASLSRRPMQRIIEPLVKMGVRIQARDNNFLPLEIHGTPKLRPILYTSPIPSAQVKSCVLLAGMQAKGPTCFQEPVKSRDHTERMLQAQGADITATRLFVTIKGPSRLKPFSIKVPGDISSAAFFMVAATLLPGSKITLCNVGINPTRDGILEVLRNMGAKITVTNTAAVSGEPVADITVESARLKSGEIKGGIMPRLIDEIPILALAATQAEGTTVISGAGELRVKESDRLKTISEELKKMGARIQEREDGLVIDGPTPLTGRDVESHGDHRVAMTLAVAGLIAAGNTRVNNTACVDTSFPGFLAELQHLSR
jgi:3-phosphoshikimate 1-carboxyvinyltransferase